MHTKYLPLNHSYERLTGKIEVPTPPQAFTHKQLRSYKQLTFGFILIMNECL